MRSGTKVYVKGQEQFWEPLLDDSVAHKEKVGEIPKV